MFKGLKALFAYLGRAKARMDETKDSNVDIAMMVYSRLVYIVEGRRVNWENIDGQVAVSEPVDTE